MLKSALNWLAVVLAAALLGGCGKPDRFAEGWDRGGNLHDATLRDWAFATDANRLATAADFVHEYLPDMPAEALPLGTALIEKCLSDRSLYAAVEYIKVRREIDSCIEYAGRQADRLAQEFAKEEAVTN
jgi:hypothetical protein